MKLLFSTQRLIPVSNLLRWYSILAYQVVLNSSTTSSKQTLQESVCISWKMNDRSSSFALLNNTNLIQKPLAPKLKFTAWKWVSLLSQPQLVFSPLLCPIESSWTLLCSGGRFPGRVPLSSLLSHSLSGLHETWKAFLMIHTAKRTTLVSRLSSFLATLSLIKFFHYTKLLWNEQRTFLNSISSSSILDKASIPQRQWTHYYWVTWQPYLSNKWTLCACVSVIMNTYPRMLPIWWRVHSCSHTSASKHWQEGFFIYDVSFYPYEARHFSSVLNHKR